MSTSVLPRRTAVLVAGVTAALTLTPVAGQAQPLNDPVDRQISAAEEKLEVVIENYNDLREDLRANAHRVDDLNIEITRLKHTIDQHRGEFGLMIANAYRASNSQSLATVTALLDAASADNLIDSLVLLTRLSREQQKLLTHLSAAHERVVTARQAAQRISEQMRGQGRQLATRKRHIEAELDRLTRLRDATGDSSRSRRGATAAHLPIMVPGAAKTVVTFAFAQLGKRYEWGGSGPDGYDCSGLTSAAWAKADVQLPHNAARQRKAVDRISRAERRPGDLVFYYPDVHHVAIYVGEGRIIHAPRPGKRIRLDRVEYQPIHSYGRPG